jgi:TRAP-type C4-dicarboxylate transport system permease large subunit
VKKAAIEATGITVMLFMVLAGATAFSQVMAISGAAQGFGQAIVALNLSPLTLLIVFEIVVFILGFPMDGVSIMLILFPIFLPIIKESGIDMILFGLVTLINIELAGRTPPFGMILYVMQAVAPPGTTSMDVWKASIPFCICDVLSIVLILCFPIIALVLPNMMTG